MFWPCETRTSTCRNFATISSGLYRFLAIAVLLDVKDIPQVGPLQRGRIKQRAIMLQIAQTWMRLGEKEDAAAAAQQQQAPPKDDKTE